MKVGDLVTRVDAIYKPDWGIGVVISCDGFSKFMVFWSKRYGEKRVSHDLYELVPCEVESA